MEDFRRSANKVSEDDESSSKLCVEVFGERWAAKTGGTLAQYEDAVRKQLDANAVTREELNEMFESAVKQREVKRRGSLGQEYFDNAIKAFRCK